MTDCLFCGVADGSVPAQIVTQSDDIVVFRDINPQAPAHMLAIPRRHVAGISQLAEEEPQLCATLMRLACEAACQEGLDLGYRLVVNSGRDGGQTVDHVHVHVLGGRRLTWPPG